mmetsp:Transcript_5059/g.8824  ORF Transcript_5059/g.8824 Transcript_5059/m.8824 type:complete len:94 (+) Transcript_5059:2581-2862(+)
MSRKLKTNPREESVVILMLWMTLNPLTRNPKSITQTLHWEHASVSKSEEKLKQPPPNNTLHDPLRPLLDLRLRGTCNRSVIGFCVPPIRTDIN